MGLNIALEDEAGNALETLTDDGNLLHGLLPAHDDDAYPMLGSIDWYGDTVFNALQMARFIAEWDRLLQREAVAGAKELAAGIRQLALRCKEGVHLYLKFIGD